MREQDGRRGFDTMALDIVGGAAAWPVTTIRDLRLPSWRQLAGDTARRCLVPLTEFCALTPDGHEAWFRVIDQPIFAIAGLWQRTIVRGEAFAMVTCDPNDLVAPVHPKAMITILEEADWDRWLHGSYDDIVALQRPYDGDRMTLRGPVFPTRKHEASI